MKKAIDIYRGCIFLFFHFIKLFSRNSFEFFHFFTQHYFEFFHFFTDLLDSLELYSAYYPILSCMLFHVSNNPAPANPTNPIDYYANPVPVNPANPINYYA